MSRQVPGALPAALPAALPVVEAAVAERGGPGGSAHRFRGLTIRAYGAASADQEKRLLLEKYDFIQEIGRETPMGVERQKDLLSEFLSAASVAMFDDKEVALAMVSACGLFLQYFSDRLRRDTDVICAAVLHCGDALQHADKAAPGLQRAELLAVKADGLALRWASQKVQADREVVLEAVKQNGLAVQHASPELRDDRDIMLEALKQSQKPWAYAGPALHDDRDVVLAALKHGPVEWHRLGPTVWSGKEVVLKALQYASVSLAQVGLALRGDPEVVLEAVKRSAAALQSASAELRACKDFVLEAVQQNGRALQWASAALRGDSEVALAAVEQCGEAWAWVGERLKADKDVVIRAVAQYPEAFRSVRCCLESDKDLIMVTLRTCLRLRPHDIGGTVESVVCSLWRPVEQLMRKRPSWSQGLELGNLHLAVEGLEANQVFQFPPRAMGFQQLARSVLAVPGARGLVVSAKLTLIADGHFRCRAHIMSGASFECTIGNDDLERAARSMPLNVQNLADKLWKELTKHTETDHHSRLFIEFQPTDDVDDNILATVWEWNQPLSDFL